jgi:ribonuclease J
VHKEKDPFVTFAKEGVVRLIPVGGCGEFGMNSTAVLYNGKLYVIDCGVRFPDPAKLGIEAVIPDYGPLFEACGGVEAYIITHGHEDHIGALSYIIDRWPAPIYGTPWTCELFRSKINRRNKDVQKYTLNEVEPGDVIRNSDISFEYIHINHSIPMACSLLIKTDTVRIFHSGDFKLDPDPMTEAPYNSERLRQIGDEGVDVVLCDSTNAHRDGHCPSEKSVFKPLLDEVAKATGAAIVTTFSSNLWRLQTVVEVCKALGKKLFIMGGGMEQTLGLGKAFGLVDIPESMMLTEAALGNTPREKLVILATGCQAEWRSALARVAKKESRLFKLTANDTVIFSSRIIPGNEKPIIDMIDLITQIGANVVTPRDNPGIHVSGHGFRGDITKLINLVRPKYFLPIHGNFQQQQSNSDTGVAAQVSPDHCRVITAGDVVDIDQNGVHWADRLEFEMKFVDSESYTPLKRETMRERHKIGELGCAVLTGVFVKNERRWSADPEIDLVGLEFPDGVDDQKWLAIQRSVLGKTVADLAKNYDNSTASITEEVRISFRRNLADVLKKKPVVLNKIRIV